MKRLQDALLKEATIIDERIIKVDHFINHMLDTKLVFDIGKEFALHFKVPTKILTIETSGIAFALATAFHLNNVPIIFAKKQQGSAQSPSVYHSSVYSFTKGIVSNVTVDQSFLNENDNVLIIDDFLAKGNAALGLIDIVKQSKATLIGVGIVIEKSFQGGRELLESKHIHLHSLARIKSLTNNTIHFFEE